MKFSRRTTWLFSVMLLVAGITVGTLFRTPHKTADAVRAAEKGARWLLSYNKPFEDPGILWMVQEMNTAYCGRDTIRQFITERLNEFSSSPAHQPYLRLFYPDHQFAVTPATLRNGAPYDDIIIPTLYCSTQPLAEDTQESILNNDSARGYDLTHTFLAMLYAQQNGCIASSSINRAVASARVKLQAEASAASYFDDLYAERVAFLEYAGFKSDISPHWIETIIRAQGENGSWESGRLFGKKEDPHATTLAVWALAQHTNTCPFR